MKSVITWAMVGAMAVSLAAPGVASANETHNRDRGSRVARAGQVARGVGRFLRSRDGARLGAAAGTLLQHVPVRGAGKAGRYIESAGAAVIAAHGAVEAAHDAQHVAGQVAETGHEVATHVSEAARDLGHRTVEAGKAAHTAFNTRR